MRNRAEAQRKRVRAVELAARGKSYDEIAREVGFTHRGSAHRAVHKALVEREVEAVDDLRRVELARLDELQVSLWPKAMGGDLSAINLVLRIIDQRIRLLGLVSKQCDAHGPKSLVIGMPEGNPGTATAR